ncbi:MAG: 50S ribosomal protein L35 [Bacillales bacterium]|jgi:large subunit ribosomal protein L35|nr:50S ribosomal protein L35 [Bacillales bacterium]
MPKMKTRSAVAKRFKVLASGKLKRKQGYRQHKAWAKTKKQRRQLSKSSLIHPTDQSRIKDLIQ